MRVRAGLTGCVAVAALACAGTPAQAAFHEMNVSEVYPGTELCPDCAFVELQMFAPGQQFVGGSHLAVYNSAGAEVADVIMDENVPNGQNNRHILLGDGSVPSRDFDANLGTFIAPGGGAVCFETFDCVSWGSFAGTLPSPAGTPVPGAIPDGSSLTRRLDRAGCETFLERADDSNDSASDFLVTAIESPQNNSSPVVGACPNTRFTKKPRRETTKRRAVFKFTATPPAAAFECKLDRRPFRACTSPFRKRVKPGKHKFRVLAEDEIAPAVHRWKVVKD